MLGYLIENSDIYSPRRLSICLKKMHEKFQRKGMVDEHTYFYIPHIGSSHVMISMMYKLANNIPNNKLFIYWKNIPREANRIVVLDDLVGTGRQMQSTISTLYSQFM